MFTDVVTVFNYYESSTGAYWYPHVLSGVHLETDRGQIIRKYGADSTDNAELHIKCARKDGQMFVTDKNGKELPFLPPKEWRKQVNDLLDDTITFGEEDFFIKGEWNGNAVINDDDYVDLKNGSFYAYMNRENDYVYKITSVGEYKLIPHFEILGA